MSTTSARPPVARPLRRDPAPLPVAGMSLTPAHLQTVTTVARQVFRDTFAGVTLAPTDPDTAESRRHFAVTLQAAAGRGHATGAGVHPLTLRERTHRFLRLALTALPQETYAAIDPHVVLIGVDLATRATGTPSVTATVDARRQARVEEAAALVAHRLLRARFVSLAVRTTAAGLTIDCAVRGDRATIAAVEPLFLREFLRILPRGDYAAFHRVTWSLLPVPATDAPALRRPPTTTLSALPPALPPALAQAHARLLLARPTPTMPAAPPQRSPVLSSGEED